jgi:hypothetical protein
MSATFDCFKVVLLPGFVAPSERRVSREIGGGAGMFSNSTLLNGSWERFCATVACGVKEVSRDVRKSTGIKKIEFVSVCFFINVDGIYYSRKIEKTIKSRVATGSNAVV